MGVRMNTRDKAAQDEVYIQRYKVDELEDERICIGLLHEMRSDAGDLIEMFIETFEGLLDELIGDNLLYFKRVDAGLYRYSRFEQYPDCDEILLDNDDAASATELKMVLGETEETISLVRQGKPIQKLDPTRNSGPKVENLTKPVRSSRLGLALPPR
jgi:hypothetical protein